MAPAVKLIVVVVAAALLADVLVLLHLAAAAAGGATTTSTTTVPPLKERLGAAFDGMAAEGGGGWMMECWSAVTKLGSCTSEIVLFFVNGESYLGPDCCVAIRTVTRRCWPAMLASVGFTAQEADILRGFCDAELAAPPPSTNASSVAPAPPPASA